MSQNTEYVIAGLTTSINTPFLYRKGTLMACVGEAGKSQAVVGGKTSHARGGDGGGVGIAGAYASGDMGSGAGGVRIPDGNLSLNGTFGSAVSAPILYPGDIQNGSNDGGQTIACTKGVYWAQQGIAACADVGTVKFRLSGGEEVTNTTTAITRGYKSGYNIIQTAGSGKRAGGMRGGNGATGGQGGGSLDAPGGGGSGYTDGSVTIVDTRLGGSTGDAKVVLRLQT